MDPRSASRDPGVLFLIGATLCFGALWTCVYACKYYGFGIDTFDAGIYSNLAYNLAHGNAFYSSVLQKHHLGEHFSPIMLAFAPLYRIAPGVQWLLGAQLAAWLAVPWLLRLVLQRQEGGVGRGWTIWLMLAWFLYQPATAAMNYPFHPSTLAMPFIVWAFYEMDRGGWVRMGLLLVFLLTFKENLFLVWIGFGLYLVAHDRRYAVGALLILMGALVGWLILDVVMPLFRDGDWQHWTRFGPAHDWTRKLRYLLFVLAPLGFLPLVYWRAGLLALPAVLPNVGSQMVLMYSRRHHYDDVVAPLLFCALAVSLPLLKKDVVRRFAPRTGIILAGLAFVIILAFADVTPLRAAWRHLPSRQSVELIAALQDFDRTHPNDFLYLPNALGIYFHRTLQAPLPAGLSNDSSDCRPGSLVVVTDLADYGIKEDTGVIVAYLAAHTNAFERVTGPTLFQVYRVR